MRWSDNSVRAHRLEFHDGTFQPTWTTVVEPPADLLAIGIIGGAGQLHQGDRTAFVYLDVDATGAAYVVVPSSPDVLPSHDAFFGEHLLDAADPTHFDYGVAIVTPALSGRGAKLRRPLGLGTDRRLLNVRATTRTLWLTGQDPHRKRSHQLGRVDQSFDASTGHVLAEHGVDVQGGDMLSGIWLRWTKGPSSPSGPRTTRRTPAG